MKAKLNNGNLEYPPKIVTVGQTNYIPPTAAWLTENGYKEVITTEAPAQDGYIAVPHWEDGENGITQTWELIPSPEDTDVL